MTEKRMVKVTKRKARKEVVSELADAADVAVSESSTLNNGAATIDPEMRRRLVAAEAYFFAERRGFSAGGEVEDWVAAERVVDSWLNRSLNS